jgi:hypothetical protein
MNRAPTRRTIAVRGKQTVVIIERRPIAGPELAQDGLGAVCAHVAPSRQVAPASERPIADEVAAALARNPIRFPAAWFHGGER